MFYCFCNLGWLVVTCENYLWPDPSTLSEFYRATYFHCLHYIYFWKKKNTNKTLHIRYWFTTSHLFQNNTYFVGKDREELFRFQHWTCKEKSNSYTKYFAPVKSKRLKRLCHVILSDSETGKIYPQTTNNSFIKCRIKYMKLVQKFGWSVLNEN